MARSNPGDVQQMLHTVTELRRRRITRNGVALITMGLILVYTDHSTTQTMGLIMTVVGIAMLVAMLRGVFDVEQRMAHSIADVLEQAHYDDAALDQFWNEAATKTAERDATNARIVMRAIEVVRERRRVPADRPPQ